MTDQHPPKPPEELTKEWWRSAPIQITDTDPSPLHVLATQAARWGWEQRGAANEAELQQARDEELEACCEWLKTKEWIHPEFSDELRDLRRPKPPSLKEQALELLEWTRLGGHISSKSADTIRRALEALPE
jgi:hypothetical protein